MPFRSRTPAHVAFALAFTTLAIGAEPTPAPAAPTSTARPAGDACAPGGLFVADDFSPTPAFPSQTRAPRLLPSSGYRAETALGHVEHGRAMAFLPDGRWLLAERNGRLRMIAADGTAGPPIAGVPIPPVPSALIGLMDIALDAGFARNRLIYLAYSTLKEAPAPPDASQAAQTGKPPDGIGHVARARLSNDARRLEGFEVIHEGARVRRLLVAADGTLFVSTVASESVGSQSLEQDGGKVLHLRGNGDPAPDNPFIERKDAGRFAYDLGHRDLDGMAQDRSGRLWAIEHGPRGGDELNLIRPGRNYGYTVIGYGREYSGKLINDGLTALAGMEQPVYFWTPSIAPSGMMIYSGRMFPQWRGNVFIGSLVAESLVRLTMSEDQVQGEEFMLSERCQRIRAVSEAPDGSIYVLTDHADGEVLRLSRQ